MMGQSYKRLNIFRPLYINIVYKKHALLKKTFFSKSSDNLSIYKINLIGIFQINLQF